MSTVILYSILATATVGEGVIIDKIVEQGVTLGALAPASIFAIVALVSVIGLIKLYSDKRKDEADLKTIIKETASAIAQNSAILDKLADVVSNCPRK